MKIKNNLLKKEMCKMETIFLRYKNQPTKQTNLFFLEGGSYKFFLKGTNLMDFLFSPASQAGILRCPSDIRTEHTHWGKAWSKPKRKVREGIFLHDIFYLKADFPGDNCVLFISSPAFNLSTVSLLYLPLQNPWIRMASFSMPLT